MIFSGTLQKLKGILPESTGDITYFLPIGQETLPLNPLLGRTLQFEFSGHIFCVHCEKSTKKSYQQGYCYLCATRLARCDFCIVRPEKCHFHLGTCREPEWGQAHCMIPHILYLSNTSQLKVGITRETQIPTRWIDQGATEALPIARMRSRYHAGLLEVAIAQQIRDKTDWRVMLKGENESLDLEHKYRELRESFETGATTFSGQVDFDWLQEKRLTLRYPVLKYPEKVKSISVEKEKCFEACLLGIKGQYLILDKGVMNIRSLTGYELTLRLPQESESGYIYNNEDINLSVHQ